jgi:hypothetical protein
MHAAVIAAGKRPINTSNRRAVVAHIVTTATRVLRMRSRLKVFGARKRRAVEMQDERTGTGAHGRDGSERVRQAAEVLSRSRDTSRCRFGSGRSQFPRRTSE